MWVSVETWDPVRACLHGCVGDCVGAKFPRPPTRRLRLSLASTHNGHVTQNLHILVGIRYGRCFAFLQAISIRFYKAMGSCLYIYIYVQKVCG